MIRHRQPVYGVQPSGGGGGSGDVTKVGTPVNDQVGVWTGDGTLEGESGLTTDGTKFNINLPLSTETTDGVSSVGLDFTTSATWSLGKLFSLSNNGTEHFYIDNDGTVHIDPSQVGHASLSSVNGGLFIQGADSVIVGDNAGTRNSSVISKSELWFGSADDASIYPTIHNAGTSTANLSIRAAHAPVNAGNSTVGGTLTLEGGDGAANASTNSDGGDLVLAGGAKVGTGSDGNIILNNVPTSDPTVAGALWNDAGTLKISAG